VKTELVKILSDLEELGQRQGWPELAQRVESLLAGSGTAPFAMLVVPGDVNAEQFRSWVLESTSYRELPQTTFTNLAHDLPARVAPRLLAFLPADRLIDAAEAEAVAQVFFSRPEGTYAIVIPNVENLGTAEDLDLIERSAWRLLVKAPPSNRAHADLLAHHVYFWSFGESAEFVSARAQRDKQALAKWLRSPVDNFDALAVKEVQGLLEEADACLRRQRNASLANQANRTKALANVIETLDEFRTRVGRRFDADAELLVGEIAGAMRDWGKELQAALHAEFAEQFLKSNVLRVDSAQEIVDHRLRQAAKEWCERIVLLIQSHQEDVKSGSEDLLDVVDWALVNEVASQNKQPQNYPETLLSYVFQSADRLDPRGLTSEPVGAIPRKAGLFSRNLIKVGLPVTAGVGIATWIMSFPLPFMSFPVLFPVSIAAGLLSTAAATHSAQHHCDSEQCQSFAAAGIQRFLSHAISHLQSETRMVAFALKRRLGEQLQPLDEMLGQAMQRSYQSADDRRHGNPADTIARLREDVKEVAGE
jgi:hypothetical protein